MKSTEQTRLSVETADPHLRSAQAVSGYQLRSGDGIIGHICDFMVAVQLFDAA
jgi:hypothetical protein